ncbi:MAG: hypothetical protein ACKVPY_06615 [Paracoccaceae bacterium]
MRTLRELRAVAAWKTGRAKWLFIHIPKNAGVTMRKAPELSGRLIGAEPWFLKSPAYRRAVLETMRERGEHHGFQHARWRDIRPEVTAALRTVAVVRNPWARTVSRWRFAVTAMDQGVSAPGYAAASFEAFLEERHVYGHLPHYWHRAIRGWYPQADYVTDEAGLRRTDVLRMERFDQDAGRYFGLAGPLLQRNRSKSGSADWRSHYDARTIGIVAEWYARDIEFFGFDFDTPATRNVTYDD